MMKLSDVGASVPLVRPYPCILGLLDATLYGTRTSKGVRA
jgi:hypothetical protein